MWCGARGGRGGRKLHFSWMWFAVQLTIQSWGSFEAKPWKAGWQRGWLCARLGRGMAAAQLRQELREKVQALWNPPTHGAFPLYAFNPVVSGASTLVKAGLLVPGQGPCLCTCVQPPPSAPDTPVQIKNACRNIP